MSKTPIVVDVDGEWGIPSVFEACFNEGGIVPFAPDGNVAPKKGSCSAKG